MNIQANQELLNILWQFELEQIEQIEQIEDMDYLEEIYDDNMLNSSNYSLFN